MGDKTVVSLPVLRHVVGLLFDELEKRHGGRVELGADFYYVLSTEAVYSPGDTPDGQECTLGSLVDDVATVREIAARLPDEHMVVLWHDLAHVNGILQRLAALDRP
ncbi:hypothetical protein [Cellulomonas sp. NS3]|uniref:hypothetical protein n=1 Tax=Cellulomonas sp. NS3 TaxID=2973977 RepID=UPI002163588C|nr:hypothetical protein [Cellulomonas sp. NS3]